MLLMMPHFTLHKLLMQAKHCLVYSCVGSQACREASHEIWHVKFQRSRELGAQGRAVYVVSMAVLSSPSSSARSSLMAANFWPVTPGSTVFCMNC